MMVASMSMRRPYRLGYRIKAYALGFLILALIVGAIVGGIALLASGPSAPDRCSGLEGPTLRACEQGVQEQEGQAH